MSVSTPESTTNADQPVEYELPWPYGRLLPLAVDAMRVVGRGR